MPTSDERREVAERLRITKAECDERDYPWMVEDLLQALGFERYEDGEDGIFDRLADLIDRPTCENEGDEWGFLCSNCGEDVAITKEIPCGGAVAPYVPSYCPNCGAEVMDNE